MDATNLINTQQPAPFQQTQREAAEQSWAYYFNAPYPKYAFSAAQWPSSKGPVPTAIPLVGILVGQGAEFTFRNGSPTFSVPDDPNADAWIKKVIKDNCLAERWIALAESCANQGSIAVKFAIDADSNECPVRISFLDMPHECRVWVDPHNLNRLLMARIQYPYRDLSDGKWYYFREEWTRDLWVTYVPKLGGDANITSRDQLPGYQNDLGDGDGWQIADMEQNPFGVVPITIIRNRVQQGNPLGVGDCWDVLRLIDRIALTLHGEDSANQLHSLPVPVSVNGRIQNEGPLLPGEPIEISNDNPDGPPADFRLLEPSGAAREYTAAYADRIEEYVWAKVGLSRVNNADVGNKGNMTALAFSLMYQRSITTSDRKRELWGASGLCRFFQNLLIGLDNYGGMRVGKVSEKTEVSCEWPSYFEPTDADKQVVTTRTVTQIEKGMLTPDRGIERIARVEGIPNHEIPDLLNNLKQHRAQAEAKAQADAGDEDDNLPGATRGGMSALASGYNTMVG